MSYYHKLSKEKAKQVLSNIILKMAKTNSKTNFTNLYASNIISSARNRKAATNKDGSTITNNSWKSKTVTKKTKDKEKLKSRDQSIGSNPNKSQKISEFTSPQSSCQQNNGLTNGDGITAAKNSSSKMGLQNDNNKPSSTKISNETTMDKEKEVVGVNEDQQATNSNSNENSSTKNSDEAGTTSIQDCGAKATKRPEESKQVEPESVQVKVEKLMENLPRGRPSKMLLERAKKWNFLKCNRTSRLVNNKRRHFKTNWRHFSTSSHQTRSV